MDPLSLSASAAGFFGLAVQIRTMLKGYISGIRNAPSEAGLLLAEIASLCSVLENLITFLGNQDLQQCRFDKTSVLRAAIEAGKEQLEGLYIKLAEIRDAFSGGKEKFKDGVVVKDGIREGIRNAVKEKVERVRWPLKKVDFQSTMGELQRFTQTFGFSLTVENCKLLAETSAEVLKKLDEKDKTINGVMDQLKAISISIPAEMLSQQTQILEIKTLVVDLGERTVKELQSISRGVDNVQERLQDSEIEKILSWISPLEPQKRHYDIRQKRLEGTGGWFLQQSKFQQWIDEYSPKQNSTDTGSILTCSGIPGAGKSVICSLVIDDLITRFPPEGDVCVAYLYCDYRDQLDQTPVNMIGALLKQAISTLNESYSLPEELVEALRKRQKKRGGEQLNLKESRDFLVKAVKQFEKFYICLDALDECNTKHCANLLESLANVTKESSQECEIRLFVTGRPHLGWEDYIRRHPSLGAPVHICLEANPDDVRKFITHEIEMDDNEGCMNDTLRNEILERIVKNSDRMFLLPALQIQTILDQPTISKRRKALLTMPTDLGDAFGATLNRMRNQKSERAAQAFDVLKWTFLAKRTLSVSEMRHALAVQLNPTDALGSDTKLDWDNLPCEKSMIDWCLGLIIVDEETTTVRLIHKSLHDYLKTLYKEGKIFQNGHGVIAQTCLTYMHFPDMDTVTHQLDFSDENETYARSVLAGRVRKFCLLEYAVANWGHHAREQPTREVETLAIGLLTNRSNTESISMYLYLYPLFVQSPSPWFLLWMFSAVFDSSVGRFFYGVQLRCDLHLAAHFGLTEYFPALLEKLGSDLNSLVDGRTPLMIAISNRHEAIVRLLLQRKDIDVHLHGKNRQDALSMAVSIGNDAIMRLLLLDRDDVNINSTQKFGQNLLSHASKNGVVSAVRLILGWENVDVNIVDSNGQTPLAWASESGHEAVVRLLLGQEDIQVNLGAGTRSGTPLSLAAREGHGAVVRLLLDHTDTGINLKDKKGRTALSFAARNGHKTVALLLLGHLDIDINAKHNDGRTALSFAAEHGRNSILRLLLDKKNIDVNTQDCSGWTALLWATEKGHASSVHLLLHAKHINVNIRDIHGRTALSRASENGYDEIVQLLLRMEGVDTNSRDDSGMTALSLASEKGHDLVVRLLLEKENISVNSENNSGSTALVLAAKNGHETVVRLLLDRPDIDINLKSKSSGQSALSTAILNDHEAIVRLLLKKDGININSKDNRGQTGLSLAVGKEQEAIVRLLVDREDVDINVKNPDSGQTVFSWAIEKQHHTILRLLLGRDDVDVHSKDDDGQTALSLAAESGNELLVRLLLEKRRMDINSQDKLGYTALLWASNNGHEAIVRLLLEREDVYVNVKDNRGRTSLLRASEKGYTSIVQLLLQRDEIDINSKDGNGRTALLLASEKGYESITRLLLEQHADVNLAHDCASTPLSLASQNGHEKVIRLLLERQDLDINAKDGYGQTALSLAAENGHEASVRLLLERTDVKVNTKDNRGRTPLSWASKNGHKSIARLLRISVTSTEKNRLVHPRRTNTTHETTENLVPTNYIAR